MKVCFIEDRCSFVKVLLKTDVVKVLLKDIVIVIDDRCSFVKVCY